MLHGVKQRGVEEHGQAIWDDSLADRAASYEHAVSDHLGTDRWIPTPQFPLVQKNKVDGAVCSGINVATHVTAKAFRDQV